MSSVHLLGRLTKDPEFRQGQNGISMFVNLADNWREKRNGEWQDGSAFYNAIIRVKDQDAYARMYQIYNGAKGKLVYVEGALRPQNSTRQGGQGMLLAIEFARLTPTWSTAQQAQAPQVAVPQNQQGFTPPQAPAVPTSPQFNAPPTVGSVATQGVSPVAPPVPPSNTAFPPPPPVTG